MASGFVVKTGAAATGLVANTAKSLVNIIPGANRQLYLVELSISFDGVTASAVPVLVELCYSTQAGAGTPGTTPTPTTVRGVGAVIATAAVDYTAEPTVLTPFKHWLITPNGGSFTLQAPLGRETLTDTSGGTNKGLVLRATAPVAVNARAYLEFEE
jgi:hypothetical protein